jgi:Zn finger protein HypA/HybF involved in hydrogenase expression
MTKGEKMSVPIENEAFELLREGLIEMIDKRLNFRPSYIVWYCKTCRQETAQQVGDDEPIGCPHCSAVNNADD